MMLAVCLPCLKCVFWLVLNVCLSLLFTTLDYETGEFGGAVHCHSCFIQDQDHYQSQGKPSKCLLIIILIIIYHACFTSEVLQKNMIIKTIFDVANTTILLYRLSLCQQLKLGNTNPLDTIWYIYHLKLLNLQSLSGHFKTCLYVAKVYGDNWWKGEPLSTKGLRSQSFLEKDRFKK